MAKKKIYKHRIFEFIFFLYLLSCVCEKLSYNIGSWGCNVYTLFTPVVFVILYILYCVKQKKLIINGYEKKIFIYYAVYIIYLATQFIVLDNNVTIRVQYIKGVIEVLVNFMAFINMVMFLSMYEEELNFKRVSELFLYITALNTFYCLLQNINPNIDAIIIDILNSDTKRYGTDSYGAINRVTGFFIESNFNGAFLLIGFINALYLIEIYKKNCKKKKTVSVSIIAGLTLFEAFMTFSLTTYIGIIAFILYKLYKSNLKYKRRIFTVLIIGCVFIIGIYFFNSDIRVVINTKLSIFKDFDALKNSSHFRIAIETLDIYKMNLRNIIFGTGLNCLNIYFQRIFGYNMMKAHSYYLQVICETGIIGFAIMFYYISLLFKKNSNRIKESNLQEAMLFSMLMMNFTYDSFFRPFNIVFLIYGMLINKNFSTKQYYIL